MKFHTFVATCLMGLSQLALAAMPPKPAHCPSAEALHTTPFFIAQKPEQAPGYVAITMGKYQTNDDWGLLMGFIEAKNADEALMAANKALPGIAGTPEPMPIEQQKVWACMYEVEGTPYRAIAITPLAPAGLNASNAATQLLK